MNSCKLTALCIRENVPLKEFCTFGIGGPARFFIVVRTTHEMQQAIFWCKQQNLDYFILGKGSNCLFDDKGFNGVVIHNKIEFLEEINPGIFHVGAGYSFALLGVQTARKSWGGLEFSSGIPASIGGAVYMNAGANGLETAEHLLSVDFVDDNGNYQTFLKEDLNFFYRHSPFQNMRGAIVSAIFSLKTNLDARKKQIEIVNKRKQTQPCGVMSAGCIFLNPSCGNAGAIIDKCGLKGLKIGGAEVSHVHANFLINNSNATCRDMQGLIAAVKEKVEEATGIKLRSEVRYIPYKEIINE
jgi:UDP-N-acetylmuramate dehydrogenase